jgi:PAS domain S-box-containing protein
MPTDNRLPEGATDIILESISDGVFTVDHSRRITSFNRAAERITGIPRNEALGKYCWEVFCSNLCERNCPLEQTLDDGRPIINSSAYIVDKQGRRIPISVSTSLLKNDHGDILGGVETFRDLREVEELRKELKESYRVGDFVSRSRAMFRIFKILPRLAESESTVLIQGETGTGKELLAQAIHHMSHRRDKPFKTINCGALPDNLLESELFGYKAGAFTDAKKNKPGQFSLAEGGTVLLDEIGDTSQAFQVKMLRFLQDRQYTPLGGEQPMTADVRVLTATNKDLASMVERGEFRQDLYYRINVVQVTLPPLRDRKEDIPLLVEHFIDRFNSLHNRNISGLSQQALSLIMAYDFPGNIRELENVIEYAFVICDQSTIEPSHLPDFLQETDLKAEPSSDMQQAVKSVEARMILDALAKHNHNRTEAAKALGLHKSTLYRKMQRFGLHPPKKPSGAPSSSSEQ